MSKEKKTFQLEKKEICITSSQIKQAIDLLINENEILQEEIERLNNIINGMEKFFQYAYDNEVKSLNDRKVSVWTICLDKLQELKGDDKE